MSRADAINLVTGSLQVGLACYAFRLNRLFGRRVGWWLCAAFGVQCLLSLAQFSFSGFASPIRSDALYALLSLLLLIALVLIERWQRERLCLEREQQAARADLEERIRE